MSSSTSTDPEVAGFRLLRELGRGTQAVVYEASQVNLGRLVALKLLPRDDGRSPHWPEHPRVVSLYATGPWERGRFVAMQLVRGPSLTRLLEKGELEPARALDLLADVASALHAAHRAGIAHGAVSAGNVLVDSHGHALLSDFGLAAIEPSVAADRACFATLARSCLGDHLPALGDPCSLEPVEVVQLARRALPSPSSPRRSRRRAGVAAGLAAVAAGAALVAVLVGSGARREPIPPPASGALALGSALASGGIASVDCGGGLPSGASQACTVVQTGLPGHRLVPPAAGVIRRWVVRGARGELALQVIRRGSAGYVSVARSRAEQISDHGVHVMAANLRVRAGDLIGVQLAPGAAIGVRRAVPGATTARWLGQFFVAPRPIELGAGTGFDHEILLRADYARGARPAPSGQLSGRAAERAPHGRELRSLAVDVRGGARRVTVVALPDAVAVDLWAGGQRLARLPALDAQPTGRLLSFSTLGFGLPLLRWRNPDGRTLSQAYAVGDRTLRARG